MQLLTKNSLLRWSAVSSVLSLKSVNQQLVEVRVGPIGVFVPGTAWFIVLNFVLAPSTGTRAQVTRSSDHDKLLSLFSKLVTHRGEAATALITIIRELNSVRRGARCSAPTGCKVLQVVVSTHIR